MGFSEDESGEEDCRATELKMTTFVAHEDVAPGFCCHPQQTRHPIVWFPQDENPVPVTDQAKASSGAVKSPTCRVAKGDSARRDGTRTPGRDPNTGTGPRNTGDGTRTPGTGPEHRDGTRTPGRGPRTPGRDPNTGTGPEHRGRDPNTGTGPETPGRDPNTGTGPEHRGRDPNTGTGTRTPGTGPEHRDGTRTPGTGPEHRGRDPNTGNGTRTPGRETGYRTGRRKIRPPRPLSHRNGERVRSGTGTGHHSHQGISARSRKRNLPVRVAGAF